jgi:hypothetical protein
MCFAEAIPPAVPHAPECTGKLLKQLALSFVDCRVSDQLAPR